MASGCGALVGATSSDASTPSFAVADLADLIFAEAGKDYQYVTALEQTGYIPINRAISGEAYWSRTMLGNIYEVGQFASIGDVQWDLAVDASKLSGVNAAAYEGAFNAAYEDLEGLSWNSGAVFMWTKGVAYPAWLNRGLSQGTVQRLSPTKIGGHNFFFTLIPPGLPPSN